MERQRPNQAMQLTASKADVCPSCVGRREHRLRFMHRGLAAAVDVFASPLSHRCPVRLYRPPGDFPARRVLAAR